MARRNKWIAHFYMNAYPRLKRIANRNGYALAVHGSLQRDCDLIAVAWTENAKPPIDMIKKMQGVFGLTYRKTKRDIFTKKPHGRLAYSLVCPCGYFDISVIPPKRKRPGRTE